MIMDRLNNTLVVISRYNEDIQWSRRIEHPVVIFDKSETPLKNAIQRPNIGREAETLLYYIITNYNNLPEKTIFLQGDPRSNPIKYTYEEVVDEINKEHDVYIATPMLTLAGGGDITHYWLKSCSALHSILFEGSNDITYSSGAQYIIPKKCILNRPLELYITLHMLLTKYGNRPLDNTYVNLNFGVDAWTMELIWGSLFDMSRKLKKDCLDRLYKLL